MRALRGFAVVPLVSFVLLAAGPLVSPSSGAADGEDEEQKKSTHTERVTVTATRLPDVVTGVETERNQVSVFWRERVAVEQIDSILDDLAEALRGLADWQWETEQEALARLSAPSSESE